MGVVPFEVWNRIGHSLVPKLKSGKNFQAEIDLSATFDATAARSLEAELRQALADLGLSHSARIEVSDED